MTRWKTTLEYDGGLFVGWQRQDNGLSVQECLEDAIVAFSGERITVRGAGRTDTGVHALGQVAHFDLADKWDARTVRDAINAHLRPHPITVLEAVPIAADFDARFSATKRVYRYRILCRHAPPVIDSGRVWHLPRELDAEAMHTAAQTLVGKHDFTTFRAAGCQADSPVRTIDSVTVTRAGEEIVIEVAARSFLYRQVRGIAGALAFVGEGKWTTADLRKALEACDRTASAPTAPASGLYFTAVEYS